jgi:translocation and assembly module TamB
MIRWRRWLLWSAAAVALLVALALTGIVIVVHSLDAPWLKGRAQRLVHDKAGLELDWQELRIDLLSGLHGKNLRALNPPAFRVIAPDLARIGAVDAEWSLGSLLGSGPKIKMVRVTQVAVAVVQDDEVGGSLDALSSAQPEQPAVSAPPLSRTLSDLLAKPLPVGELTVESVSLAQVHSGHGETLERWSVEGLGVHVSGHTHVEVSAPGLAVTHTRLGAPVQSARATLLVGVGASRDQVRADVDVEIAQQDFLPKIPVRQLLHLAATLRVDPAAHQLEIQLDSAEVADLSATLQASVVLPDGRKPRVERATGNIDLGALSHLSSAFDPPARVERGALRFDVHALSLDGVGPLPFDGALKLEAELDDLQAPPWSVRALKVATELTSASGSPKGHLLLTAKGAGGGPHLSVPDLTAEVTAADQSTLEVAVAARELDMPGLRVEGAHLRLRAAELVIPPAAPLQARGKIDVSARVGMLRLPQASLAKVSLEAGTVLAGEPVFAGQLRVEGDVGARSIREHAVVRTEWNQVSPDLEVPIRTIGKARVHVELTSGTASVDLAKVRDAVDATLAVRLPTLSRLKAFGLTDHPAGFGWAAASLSLDTQAHLERLTSPVPRLHSQIDLAVARLEREGATGDEKAHAVVDLDLARPSLGLQLETSGTVGPLARLKVQAGFDRTSRKVLANIEAHASHLGGLPVPSLDPSALEVNLTAQAALQGLVQGISPSGQLRLAPKPAETATGSGSVEVGLANVKWEQLDRQIEAPSATLHVEARGEGSDRSADVSFSASHLRVSSGDVQVDMTGTKAGVRAKGRPQTGEVSVEANVSADEIDQDAAPEYAIGGLAITLSGEREKGGVIHVSNATVENQAAGTTIRLRGALAPEDLPPKLSLHATVQQDLAKAWRAAATYAGSGKATVTVAVESPDLRIFHTAARVALAGAHIHLPKAGLVAEPIEAEIPIVLTLGRTASGFELLRVKRINPYSILRFEDQHALLSGRSFLSIGKVELPGLSIAPLAGNIQVDQSAVSLSQLEMGLRGGRITGNCILDWDGWKSHLRADIRANGVQSSYGEPFDGNFAFVVSAKDRTVDGHAEILRIGRRHLYDLLDLQDPHHVAPAFNRVRQALALGYPEHVRLLFDRGFASAKLSFGGVASLVRVDELRGIPMEPLLDKFISPQLAQTEEP